MSYNTTSIRNIFTFAQVFNPPYHMFDTPYHMFDTPYHMFDTPYHLFDTPYHMFNPPYHLFDTPYHIQSITTTALHLINISLFTPSSTYPVGEAFLRHHGESAPFIAAAYCTDTGSGSGLGLGTSGGPPSEERRMALAYMRTFSAGDLG